MKNRAAFWPPTLALIVFLGMVITWADRGAMPPLIMLLYAFPAGDKIGHLLLMGTLAAMVNLSLAARRISLWKRRALLGSLLVALGITLEEASQLFFPGRTFSLVDLGMGYLGVFLSRYPVAWIYHIHPTSEQRSSS